MPEQYEQQRTLKRREEDQCREHCKVHDDTIERIGEMAVAQAEQRTESRTVKWVLGLGLPILVLLISAFWGNYVRNSDSASLHQDRISASVETVKVMVQAGLVDSATDRAKTNNRLDNIEQEVGDLKRRLDGRGK